MASGFANLPGFTPNYPVDVNILYLIVIDLMV